MHAALSPYSAWQDYQTQWCILHYHTTTVYSKMKVVKSPSTIFFNKFTSCSNSSSHFHILCLWKLPLKCCNMETIRWQVFLQEKSWKKRGAFTSSILCFPIGIIIAAPFPKLNLSRCFPIYPRQSNEETNSEKGFSAMRNTKMTHGPISCSWCLSCCPLTLLWKHKMPGHRLVVPVP